MTNLKLYEVHDAIEQILATAVDENGEITEETEAQLDALEMERDQIALYLARVILGERAEGEAVKSQADRLAKRARVHKNRAERLRAYIEKHLPPGTKLSDDVAQIGWRRSEAVIVDEGVRLPDSCLRWSDPEPDKKVIRERVKAGETIDGARLERRIGLQVR